MKADILFLSDLYWLGKQYFKIKALWDTALYRDKFQKEFIFNESQTKWKCLSNDSDYALFLVTVYVRV